LEPQFKKYIFMGLAWWNMSIIPASLEAEEGGSRFKPSQDKSLRPYLRHKLGLEV
jgi:hypothetical protein